MPLAAGTRLGTYEILTAIGAGGMGEVYRAHDEQLHRIVAIKVLPTASTDDPAARVRLVREARAAAALNHPHICTVHQVGEADGQTFIAMELVEGETLSARLAAGPLPPEQVGFGYDRATEFLAGLGVGEICVFERRGRRLEPIGAAVGEDPEG